MMPSRHKQYKEGPSALSGKVRSTYRRTEVLRYAPKAEKFVEREDPIDMCQLCLYVSRMAVKNGLCVAVQACRKRQHEADLIERRFSAEDPS
jgi:hypothetical protein